MKRIISLILALLLMTGSAQAAVLLADAPGTPTQARTVTTEAVWQDGSDTAYEITGLPVDQLIVDMTMDVFDFVYEEGNRPARWFPEETQRAIEELIGMSPDALSLTDFMRMEAAEAEVSSDLVVNMQTETDYAPGETIVIVLGAVSDSGETVWTPVKAKVPALGQLEYTIPQEVMATLQGSQPVFSAMSARGSGAGPTESEDKKPPKPTYEEIEEIIIRPSMEAEYIVHIVQSNIPEGEESHNTEGEANVSADDFWMYLAPTTDLMKQALADMKSFASEKQQPVISWLPDEAEHGARYLLGDAADGLVLAEYAALKTVGYYYQGVDAVATFTFGADYQPGDQLVSAIGVPKTDAAGNDYLDWTAQPVFVRDNGKVDIVFNRLALDVMENEACLLLVFSEPAAEG